MTVASSPPEGWDEEVLSGDSASLLLYHTTAWADRLKALLGYVPVYFRVAGETGQRVHLLGFIAPPTKPGASAPAHRKVRFHVGKLIAAVKRQRAFLWHGQPVVSGAWDPLLAAALSRELASYLKLNRLRLVRGEWPTSRLSDLPQEWQVAPWATLQVDLTPPLSEIKSSLKSAARKEIRKGESQGLTVRRVASESELEAYVRFARECARRYAGWG